jgi:CRP/FNR family transcriptional regulator
MDAIQRSNVFSLQAFRSACSECTVRELCLPVGLKSTEIKELDRLIDTRHPISKGTTLYRSGDRFRALYAVRTGFFKTCLLHEDGREQVTGFQMMGELLGMDAISTDSHACDAVALEDSEVCEIPFEALEQVSSKIPTLQHHFHRMLSREIVRDQSLLMLLGSMRAEERLAAFLLNLSKRFVERGFAKDEFILRMTREDIGSYLGMKLETVSRTFSRFNAEGIISVHGKAIHIQQPDALNDLTSRHS